MHAFVDIILIIFLASVFLPPPHTIDIYFLRQIMTGEKKVLNLKVSIFIYPIWNKLFKI